MPQQMKQSMPTNKKVYCGYLMVALPTLYWLSLTLHFFGLGIFYNTFLFLPRPALMIITVILPSIGFIIGAVTYLVHPNEKRKLAYQSLIALSMVYILLIIIQLIDGSLM